MQEVWSCLDVSTNLYALKLISSSGISAADEGGEVPSFLLFMHNWIIRIHKHFGQPRESISSDYNKGIIHSVKRFSFAPKGW
jgi:hypothetical protein